MAYSFYIVDVFAENKYCGNQLAVVLDAGNLSDAEMQLIAREMNYSETTFILSDQPNDGGYNVRIFTPETELPFAGHPTLGTAFIIQQEIIKMPVDKVVLNLKVGQIPVSFKPDAVLWMQQILPVFGATLLPEQVARVLGIDTSDLDARFPIQEVSTGLPFVIVPLKTLAAVKRCKTNRDKLMKLVKDIEAKAILVFCPETYDEKNDLNVRVFVDCYGVPEDPATGSANGCLAGYLSKYRYFGDNSIDIIVEQGFEINRPSLLYLSATYNAGDVEIYVGGKVVMTAKGELV